MDEGPPGLTPAVAGCSGGAELSTGGSCALCGLNPALGERTESACDADAAIVDDDRADLHRLRLPLVLALPGDRGAVGQDLLGMLLQKLASWHR